MDMDMKGYGLTQIDRGGHVLIKEVYGMDMG